jgi:HK97 family phage major capsid protein
MFDVKEILASNDALKTEVNTVLASIRKDGKTPELQAKYDEIKAKIEANNDLLRKAAEVATFDVPVSGVTAPKKDNKEVVDAQSFRASKEFGSGFKAYVQSRGGNVADLKSQILAVNLNTQDFVSSDGVVLPTTFDQDIVKIANAAVAMRQLATVINTVRDLPFVVETAHGSAAPTAEANGLDSPPYSASEYPQDDPDFEIKVLKAYKNAEYIPVSEELFEDFNAFQGYLPGRLGLNLAEAEEAWFIQGSGSDEPEGVVTAATEGYTKSDSSTEIDFIVDLNKLKGALKPTYRNGATFIMHQDTETYLRTLTNDLGLPFWPWDQATLFGYNVVLSDSMDTIGAGKKVVLFGNFKQAVVIGDRGGLVIKIDDRSAARHGKVELTGRRRVDQVVILPEAIKYLAMKS